MLTKHLTVTYSMVWTLVIANIITVLLSLAVLNHLAKLTYIRGGLIIPFVLIIGFRRQLHRQQPYRRFGRYLLFRLCSATSWCWLGWPRPPLVLGFVSGEACRDLSFHLGGSIWFFLARPPFVLLLIVLHGRCHGLSFRPGKAPQGPGAATDEQVKVDLLFSLFLMLVAGYAALSASHWSFKAGFFPLPCHSSHCPHGTFNSSWNFSAHKKKPAALRWKRSLPDVAPEVARGGSIEILAWIGGFILLVFLVGFPIAVPLVYVFLLELCKAGSVGCNRWL